MYPITLYEKKARSYRGSNLQLRTWEGRTSGFEKSCIKPGSFKYTRGIPACLSLANFSKMFPRCISIINLRRRIDRSISMRVTSYMIFWRMRSVRMRSRMALSSVMSIRIMAIDFLAGHGRTMGGSSGTPHAISSMNFDRSSSHFFSSVKTLLPNAALLDHSTNDACAPFPICI